MNKTQKIIILTSGLVVLLPGLLLLSLRLTPEVSPISEGLSSFVVVGGSPDLRERATIVLYLLFVLLVVIVAGSLTWLNREKISPREMRE